MVAQPVPFAQHLVAEGSENDPRGGSRSPGKWANPLSPRSSLRTKSKSEVRRATGLRIAAPAPHCHTPPRVATGTTAAAGITNERC
jgi:hypothetical protein